MGEAGAAKILEGVANRLGPEDAVEFADLDQGDNLRIKPLDNLIEGQLLLCRIGVA